VAIALRGRALSLVGLLRLYLVLPTEPFDPAAKYNTKMTHFEEELEELKVRISVLTKAELFVTGRSTNEKIKALQTRVSELEALMATLRGKVVVRPESTLHDSFGELHRYTQSLVATNGSCGMNRVLQLLTTITNDYNVLASSPVDISKSDRAAQTEQTWQSNASQLVATIQLKFSAAYPDVALPIISALYQIKRGVRLVKIGAEFASKFPDSDKNASASSKDTSVNSFYLPSLVGKTLFTATKQIQRVAIKLVEIPRGASSVSQVMKEVEDLLLAPLTFESIEAMFILNAKQSTTN